MSTFSCDYCDGLGGIKTYANQACMPINGKVQCIDFCIHHIVAALNAGGVETRASCCGHGKMPGNIMLADGRVLAIFKSERDARMCDTHESNKNSRSPENTPPFWQPPRLDGSL